MLARCARQVGWLTWASVSPSCVCTGKVKKELDHDDSHLNLDETTKLLQDLHEAQAERGGSRPSSNLSSLSNTSDRDQHHLGKVASGLTSAPNRLTSVWEESRIADCQERLEILGGCSLCQQ